MESDQKEFVTKTCELTKQWGTYSMKVDVLREKTSGIKGAIRVSC